MFPAGHQCHTGTATRDACGVCKPGSMATTPSAAHQNQIHSCTSSWNSRFAVDDSDEIPHSDDDTATSHFMSAGHSRFDVSRELQGCICLDCSFPRSLSLYLPGKGDGLAERPRLGTCRHGFGAGWIELGTARVRAR